ncbi:MAG: xylose isomerase [Candidatus Margulisiibacteriota bacterium]
MAVLIQARKVMDSPLMSRAAMSSRILDNLKVGKLPLKAATRRDLVTQAVRSDRAMLEKAFAGQIFYDTPSLKYEGPTSKNPLSYKLYNPDMMVDGKALRDHLKLCVAFWHAMNNDLSDPFGGGTLSRPWDNMYDPLAQAVVKLGGSFELMEKIGFPFWAFHDYDLISGDDTLKNMRTKLNFLTDIAKGLQRSTGVKLGWTTNQLFVLPIYMEGAATAPKTWPFMRAVAQCKQTVKNAIKLGGKALVFWGGREGFINLVNTLTDVEKEHLALFLKEVIAMARKMGFEGEFWIEPKAFEPTMHQYDREIEVVQGFLIKYGLENDIKINFEPNHGELALLSAEEQLDVAGMQLGSIDINCGEFGIGYDVDKFTDFMTALAVMRKVIELREKGGFTNGLMNIDAKLRRTSTDFPGDLFHGMIKTADTLTAAFMLAKLERKDHVVRDHVAQRYGDWQTAIGRAITHGRFRGDFGSLADFALKNEGALSCKLPSGSIEMLENRRDLALFAAISGAFGTYGLGQ